MILSGFYLFHPWLYEAPIRFVFQRSRGASADPLQGGFDTLRPLPPVWSQEGLVMERLRHHPVCPTPPPPAPSGRSRTTKKRKKKELRPAGQTRIRICIGLLMHLRLQVR